jgi:hypothetical protein
MPSKAIIQEEFVQTIAEEVASGVAGAVELWMAEFDEVLQDPHLTTLGRLRRLRQS